MTQVEYTSIDRLLRTFGQFVVQSGIGPAVQYSSDSPNIFYCDPNHANAADTNDGRDPNFPFATLQAAINATTAARGDVIFMLGSETVTQTVSFNKAGISVYALDRGAPPGITGEYIALLADATFTDGPVATVTAQCRIEGLGFAGRDTGATFFDGAAMLIGGLATALPFGVHIKNCRFPKWNLDNRIGIAIEGTTDVLIEGCVFEGVGSDFDSGIYVQGATQNLVIRDCYFRDCTYGILFGAFAGGGPHCIIHRNYFEDSKMLSAASAATGLIADNWCEGATDTGSYNDTVDNLNTLGLVFSDQHYAE